MRSCNKEFKRGNMSQLRVCGQHDEYFEDISYCDYCRGFHDAKLRFAKRGKDE